MFSNMDLMWLIWVLKILLSFIFDTAADLTVVKQGDRVTLACTDSPTIRPSWSGPPDNTIYNYFGLSTLNPNLGEKLSRLSWYSDNKSLIIRNVMKNDSGTYICFYIIESTTMIITHKLSVRVLPQPPVISNAETLDGTRSVVRGTEGQVLTLQCTSTGGYPEPLLYWYKDNTQTQPLDTIKTSQEDSDGTFMVEVTHTFTPSNQDDDVTFVCQSSFSPPEPSEQTVQVQLLLNLKPSPPVVTSYPVVEGVSGKVVDCRTSGFRPDNIDVWLQMNGNNLTSNPSVTRGTGQTFSAVASYREILQRQQNGKPLVCQVAHQTLQTPLSGSGTADVRFRPLTAALTGTVFNIVVESDAKITLTCTSGSSNPKSTITWYRDGVQIPNPASVIETTGDYSGVVTSQIYEFVPDRSMDGERVHCTVHNSIEGQPPVRSKTKTLDLLYHPIVKVTVFRLTASLTGSVSNIVVRGNAIITLICTSGTSNPKSAITWYRGGVQIPNPAAVIESTDYSGVVTSQILEFSPTRNMDGQKMFCTIYNSIDSKPPVRSETKTLDLLYHPLVTLSGTRDVEEGSTTLLVCEVDSNPKSTVTWFHNDKALAAGGNAINESAFEYRILVTNRTDSGTYKCAALNGHGPSDESEITLLVKYTPDVTVTSNNVTVNDSLAVLNCIPSGRPTTYVYSEWQHIWPGYGRVDHPTRLGNEPVLALSALTYEYSGIYICTVSNGVSGSLRPNAGYGTVFLQVDTFPVITTPTPMKVYSNIGDTAVAYVHFYSNRPDNKVDCFRGLIQVDCYSEILNGDIELPVFGTIIPTFGSVASVSIDIYNMSQYGMYNIRISNGIGTSSIDTDIVPEDKQPENQNNTGAIVGGTVGASVLVLGGVVFFMIWVKYLRQRTSKAPGTGSSNLAVERTDNSTENNASGIRLDLDGHKDVYYNIERNVYDELQERSGDIHEYEAIDRLRQIETSDPKNKEYDNLQLR